MKIAIDKEVSDLNKKYNPKTFGFNVEYTASAEARELSHWNIEGSISLLAQLKYHNPKLFVLLGEAIDYFYDLDGKGFFLLSTRMKFQELLDAGSGARGKGESIFNRAYYHYYNAKEIERNKARVPKLVVNPKE